ncbi:hypothetical protein [Streptomyces chumphonensis]|uniref:hypothetical protein n=1 Tax=Streptomyces chumphonensis TaxID=1214925 RepID=UPI003D70CEA8
MGWTVLYILFGVVALWLLGEVLLQYKARLRWRLTAFFGFLTVVLGVLLGSVPVIALGTAAFAVGQFLVTLSFRRGFDHGWALENVPGTRRRRAKDGSDSDAPPQPADAPPVLEVSELEETAAYRMEPLPEEDTGQYGVYDRDGADGGDGLGGEAGRREQPEAAPYAAAPPDPYATPGGYGYDGGYESGYGYDGGYGTPYGTPQGPSGAPDPLGDSGEHRYANAGYAQDVPDFPADPYTGDHRDDRSYGGGYPTPAPQSETGAYASYASYDGYQSDGGGQGDLYGYPAPPAPGGYDPLGGPDPLGGLGAQGGYPSGGYDSGGYETYGYPTAPPAQEPAAYGRYPEEPGSWAEVPHQRDAAAPHAAPEQQPYPYQDGYDYGYGYPAPGQQPRN